MFRLCPRGTTLFQLLPHQYPPAMPVQANLRRVAVTGAAGYIGSHAALALLESGHEVLGIDDLSRGNRWAVDALATFGGSRFGFLQADILDEPRVTEALGDFGADSLMHFAALAEVSESVREPLRYWRTNAAGTISLLRAAGVAGVRRIVFSSTCATYGVPPPEAIPIVESCPQRPINPYGASKLAAERVLIDAVTADRLNLDAIVDSGGAPLAVAILRYFNVAGCDAQGRLGEDHRPETHLVPICLEVALEQRPHLAICGTDYPTPDGTCVRDYVHVSDLVDAHLLALRRLEPGEVIIANIGLGHGFSVREVLESCRRVTGHRIPHRVAPRRPGDPPVLQADPAFARRELRWTPRFTSLDEIVASAWAWRRTRAPSR